MKTFFTTAMFGMGIVVMSMILLLAFFAAAIYNICYRIVKGDI